VVDKVKSKKLGDHESDDGHPIHDFEKCYRQDHPVAWWLALLGPVVITALILGLIYFIQGWETAASYPAAAASAFFALGRFIILLGGDEPNQEGGLWFLKYLDARSLFLMLTYMDVMVAMFVAFHMGIVFRLPWVGPKIKDIVSDGQFILRKQPWIRRSAFIGLVCFVIFPTSTTGSVGGSIFGRLLGMNRWRVVFAILMGSVLGNGLMLLFAEQISRLDLKDSWTLRITGVIGMIVALYFIERKFRRLKNEYLAQEQLNQQLAQSPDSEPSINGQDRPSLPKKSANS
jgi:uncharacterized membrane protein